MDAYCLKCKAKREISSPAQVTFTNGRQATRGTCPVCGTRVFRIGKGSSRVVPHAKRAAPKRGACLRSWVFIGDSAALKAFP